ncbi:MAG: type II toxin-antitoxin system RelE/ParE family toxin [Parachlamydiaceae bacterium]|nr:type II toxin-antitoxin system RelE/ParE family toxin [Parachlamydiaceae bacterium]
MKYRIFYDLASKNKDFERIPSSIREIIKKAIQKKLTIDPVNFGKPLRYSLKGYRSLRVGEYRVIYKIDEDKVIVIIVDIDHRKDIYEID